MNRPSPVRCAQVARWCARLRRAWSTGSRPQSRRARLATPGDVEAVSASRPQPGWARAARGRSRIGHPWAGTWREELGSASIWLVAAGVVVVLFGAGAAQAGAAMVARHQAMAAADAGALAGARLAYAGADIACDRAGELVTGNRAQMASCEVDGLFVTVAAEVTVNAAITARATAKAGPVSG